jgi:hypothetical protein
MAETMSRSGAVSLVKVGGALAIAGTIIGALIFLAACFGFGASFTLSIIPTIFGAVGLVLAIIGDDSAPGRGRGHARAGARSCSASRAWLGGLIEIAIWRGVPIFAGASGM